VATLETVPTIAPTEIPTPTPDLTGPVGTTYTDTNSGQNYSYMVTLTSVTDPARATTQPVAGAHFVTLRFKIVGVTGIDSSDDAAADANVVGSDGQPYNTTADNTRDCNFNLSAPNAMPPYSFSTTPGAMATPCVVFQVLNGVKIASATWGIVGQKATWTVNS
jgi:hypothetical protein